MGQKHRDVFQEAQRLTRPWVPTCLLGLMGASPMNVVIMVTLSCNVSRQPPGRGFMAQRASFWVSCSGAPKIKPTAE